ncbi:MAG: type II secretion system F family protein [Spirochaetales bacterium]|nr:type II secretion system F family protein [Spirochaetales bacterium]
MPIYRYIALNRNGKEEKGIIDASNPQAARKVLRAKNLYVRELVQDREKKERELFPFLTKILYRVPRRDVALFVRQLGTLLSAGLSLPNALANIIDQTENEYLKKAIIQIRSDAIEGTALSECFRKQEAIFPPIYYNLISVGEKTGIYDQSLINLADLEDRNLAMVNKVTTTLMYPVIMLFLLGAIAIFLLAYVFPQIKQLFAQLNAELPLVTRIVMGVSDLLTTPLYLLGLIAVIAGLVYAFIRWKSTPDGRTTYEKTMLKIPFAGTLIRKAVLARFTRNLAVMLANRVQLTVALQIVARVVNHSIFEKEILIALDRIKEGSKMTDSLRDSSIASQMMLGMMAAGEASDQVPEMMERIASVLEGDVDAAIMRFSTVLEPAMMVIMGATIALLMVSIMLPLYNLTKAMQV